MRKITFLMSGVLAGVAMSIGVSVFILREAFDAQPDPEHDMVAVSWGAPIGQEEPWIYQVQVLGSDVDKDGVLDISARVCIGGSSYFQDLGKLGNAANMGEAQRKFGSVTWESDKVTIGGDDGLKASLARSDLEDHR